MNMLFPNPLFKASVVGLRNVTAYWIFASFSMMIVAFRNTVYITIDVSVTV